MSIDKSKPEPKQPIAWLVAVSFYMITMVTNDLRIFEMNFEIWYGFNRGADKMVATLRVLDIVSVVEYKAIRI